MALIDYVIGVIYCAISVIVKKKNKKNKLKLLKMDKKIYRGHSW
jgi:hypothetical protein